MTFYRKVTFLEFENSTICNARCPHCLREELGPDSGKFDQEYLPTNFFEESIPQKVYDDLERIHFGGTLGDPCAAPNFLEVIDVIKKKNSNIKITVSTNGGMKGIEWWISLAKKLSTNDKVIFAIDGLENTNHIYRVNVIWNYLIKNVKAFIDAGGNASWQFIVFGHNEHQRDQAKELAKKLGFKEFVLKKSHRFPVSEMKGIKIIGSNNIEITPSSLPEFVNEIKILPNTKTWQQDTAHLDIDCDAITENSVYIDAKGRLFPCCYIAGAIYQYETNFGKDVNQGWDELWNQYGNDHINLKYHHWDTIINGKFYKEIKRKWTASDRLSACVFFCGANAKSPWPTITNFSTDQ